MARDMNEAVLKGLLIVPLTKSPWSEGRIGPKKLQDWYGGLRIAKRLLDDAKAKGIEAHILILTAFHANGQPSEQECYQEALKELGVSPRDILIREECLETIGQIDTADIMAINSHLRLVLISAWLQHPRVLWLSRGGKCEHHIAWGIPRLSDFFWDPVLTGAFPILDVIGLRKWFQDKTIRRREKGIL